MSRALISWAIALVALIAVFAICNDSRADGPEKTTGATAESAAKQPHAADSKPADASPDAKRTDQTAVERALADPAEFKFMDTPLKDVAAFVADHFKINVLLDAKAIADAGVTGDTPITQNVKGVSLGAALELALAVHDLSYFQTDDNVLLITTAEVAKTRVTTKIYPVPNFADPVGEFSAGPKTWTQISEIVTATVAPASWASNGGPGSIEFFDGKLIVTQTGEIQSVVADLLSQLETARTLAMATGDREIPVELVSKDSTQTKIEQVLDSRQDFLFTDVPLGDVVQILQKQLGVEVQLDIKALNDAGVTADTPMSLKLKQVRARVGLRELLNPRDMDFVIDHEVLLITTADVSKRKTVTRLYPVVDLIGDADPSGVDDSYDSLVTAITGAVAPSAWDSNGGAGSIAPFPSSKVLVISQTENVHLEIKSLLTSLRADRKKSVRTPAASNTAPVVRIYPLTNVIRFSTAADDKQGEQIVEMVTKLIEPKSWSDPNAYIGLASGSLVVRQTPAVHRQIQDLLNALGPIPTGRTGSGVSAVAPGARSGGLGGGFNGGGLGSGGAF